MGNYSKIIGAVVGFAMSMLVNFGVLPAEYATPEIQVTITGIFMSVFTFFFPANKPAVPAAK